MWAFQVGRGAGWETKVQRKEEACGLSSEQLGFSPEELGGGAAYSRPHMPPWVPAEGLPAGLEKLVGQVGASRLGSRMKGCQVQDTGKTEHKEKQV